MPKLSKSEKMYIKLIQRDFEITENAIHVKRYNSKETYEQMYNRMNDEEKLIREFQDFFAVNNVSTIYHLFKEPNNKQMAHDFTNRLFAIDPTKPINKSTVKTCRRIANEISIKI